MASLASSFLRSSLQPRSFKHLPLLAPTYLFLLFFACPFLQALPFEPRQLFLSLPYPFSPLSVEVEPMHSTVAPPSCSSVFNLFHPCQYSCPPPPIFSAPSSPPTCCTFALYALSLHPSPQTVKPLQHTSFLAIPHPSPFSPCPTPPFSSAQILFPSFPGLGHVASLTLVLAVTIFLFLNATLTSLCLCRTYILSLFQCCLTPAFPCRMTMQLVSYSASPQLH